NEFVAGFIGSPPMNMLAFDKASLRGEDLLLEGKGEPGRIPSLGPLLQTAPARGAHKLGSRAGAIGVGGARAPATPAGAGAGRGGGRRRGRLGAHDVFRVACAGEGLLVEAPPQVPGAVGDVVGLFFPPARVHLFEATSGRRLAVRDAAARAA